jgi:hypothetical protein
MAGETDDNKDLSKDDNFTDKFNPDELDEALQPAYKSMQADYTRKTQDVAEQNRLFDERVAKWEQENAQKFEDFGKLQKEVEQWRAWSASLSQDDDTTNDDLDHGKTGDHTDDDYATKFQKLESELEALKQGTKKSEEEVGRMLRYQDELNEIIREDPEANKDDMIKFMLDEGINEPRRAHKELYQDRIAEARAKELFDKHVAEWEEKQKADMLTGPGGATIKSSFYKPPTSGKPDAWDKTLDEVEMAHRRSQMGLEPYET